jgi:hypothetical protein
VGALKEWIDHEEMNKDSMHIDDTVPVIATAEENPHECRKTGPSKGHCKQICATGGLTRLQGRGKPKEQEEKLQKEWKIDQTLNKEQELKKDKAVSNRDQEPTWKLLWNTATDSLKNSDYVNNTTKIVYSRQKQTSSDNSDSQTRKTTT